MRSPNPCRLLMIIASLAATVCADEKPQRAVLKTEYGDVEIFPTDNPWNTDISELKVHPRSEQWIRSIGLDTPVHPDFGAEYEGVPIGIPFVVVDGNKQKKVSISFKYAEESDPGPYPIPDGAPIEGGPDSDGDRHILVVDATNKKLYETYNTFPDGQGWKADGGAIFDLTSNKLRPKGWTSADAAGLPIFPGLVRYDEVVEQGEIRHALRFTCRKTQRAYINPATHWASDERNPTLPPMGMRVRLKADYNIEEFPEEMQVILKALKKYGMFLADNGSDWFITGAHNPNWDADLLRTIKKVKGSDFEAVMTGPIVTK